MPPRCDPGVPCRVRVGCDVVAVDRFADLMERHAGLSDVLFSPGELRAGGTGPRRAERLAARFAAKEAVLKALGTGLAARMRWTDVEVTNNYRGRPSVRLTGAVADRARACGVVDIDVTLSHVREIAMAQAVAVSPASAPLPEEDE